MNDSAEEPDHSEYYLIGGVTLVRVAFDKASRKMDAEVPNAASPSGLRHAATYLTRLDVADFVHAIDKDTFEAQARTYRERQNRPSP